MARPEAAQTAAMSVRWYADEYNVLDIELPAGSGTAGSTALSELDGSFLSRTPTRKSGYTGLLAGRDLVLLLAEQWRPETAGQVQTPALWRLRTEGLRFTRAYAPDWYQADDGRQFALLTGMTPTTQEDSTSMAWVGAEGTYLPFSLGRCLGRAGYDCRVYAPEQGRQAAYEALGFTPGPWAGADGDTLEQALPQMASDRPFAAVFVLTGRDGEQTMARLWQTLSETGLERDTVLCLVAGGDEPLRGSITLWAEGLAAGEVDVPCSELDVTPTLLDMLGAAYDARFLSGRDALAPDAGGLPVSLGGSAYADWVTDAGSYSAGEGLFTPADGGFSSARETDRYVQRMCQAVYEQYVCARQALQCDYFRVRMGP